VLLAQVGKSSTSLFGFDPTELLGRCLTTVIDCLAPPGTPGKKSITSRAPLLARGTCKFWHNTVCRVVQSPCRNFLGGLDFFQWVPALMAMIAVRYVGPAISTVAWTCPFTLESCSACSCCRPQSFLCHGCTRGRSSGGGTCDDAARQASSHAAR
jgi:hypothetical protein